MDPITKKQILEIINQIPTSGEGGLKSFIENNDITLDEMKEAGLDANKIKELDTINDAEREAEIKEEEVRKIKVDIENECQKIKDNKYSVGQIKKLINDNSLSKEDLFNHVGMEENHYQRIKNYNKRPTEFHEWEDIPDIQKNRTDIYFLGQPGSGK